jgi:hypothetical protein
MSSVPGSNYRCDQLLSLLTNGKLRRRTGVTDDRLDGYESQQKKLNPILKVYPSKRSARYLVSD